MSPHGPAKAGIIPPYAGDCIAIFVKQFCKTVLAGSLAAEDISLDGGVNGESANGALFLPAPSQLLLF